MRFLAAVLGAATMTFVIILLLPKKLSVVTNVVGYPIHHDFNFKLYFWRYYLTVLFFPALAAAIYHLLGRRWPDARWPDHAAPEIVAEPTIEPVGLALRQLLRALAVGATLGLGLVFLDGQAHFWRDVAGVAVAYALFLAGAAALLHRLRRRLRFAHLLAMLNALCAPLTVLSLYAVSSATRVTVLSDASVHRYPWLPGWTALAIVALLVSLTAVRLRGDARRIEAQQLVFIVAPVLLYIYGAMLAPPLGAFDSFHFGEFLAGARLLERGAFPWRDALYIHGLLQDALYALWGFKLYGESAWAGWTGFFMIAAPLWWIGLWFLLVYLLRGNWMLLLAALSVPLLGAYPHAFERFVPLPAILLALAALLHRATWVRAFLLAFILLASNILVPELAYAVPACGVALLGFELTRGGRELPRTLRVIAAGAVMSALWFAWLARHGAAGAFVHYYLTFAPDHALAGAIRHSRGFDFFVFMLLPPALVQLAFWYGVAAVRLRWKVSERDWVALAIAVITLLYYVKFLSRADWHVVHSISPALPLVYYALHKALPLLGLRRRLPLAVGGAAVLAMTIVIAPLHLEGLERVSSSFARAVTGNPAAPELGWSEPSLAAQAGQWADLHRFLDATLLPDDAIFDFSNQPGLYHFVLGRKPATRYYHVSMAVRRAVQLDLVEELERSQPKLVVYSAESGGLAEWDGVPNEVRHYEIARYILSHYRPYARVRGNLFYARNGAQLPPQAIAVDEAYSHARACDWGQAPRFMRSEWLEADGAAAPRERIHANHLYLAGWAADARLRQPAAEVLAVVGGKIVARAVPALLRPDVAAHLNTPAVEGYGYEIRRDWTGDPPIDAADLRVYGVSREGKAWPLISHLGGSSPPPAGIPLERGAAEGYVDTDDVRAGIVAAWELPAAAQLPDVSGLEIEVTTSRETSVEVSDKQFSSGSPISFYVGRAGPGLYRVMFESCPQWHALHGRTIYLSYDESAEVRAVRVLNSGTQYLIPTSAGRP